MLEKNTLVMVEWLDDTKDQDFLIAIGWVVEDGEETLIIEAENKNYILAKTDIKTTAFPKTQKIALSKDK